MVLYVHLTDTIVRTMTTGERRQCGSAAMGRVENTSTPVTADTIREWVGDPHTTVALKPVIDLAQYLHADAYEVPARLKELVRLRDGSCLFPGCHAPGLRSQHDHREPYDYDDPEAGGHTESGNLFLLCAHHHNLKTHHGFRYAMLPGGAILWRTPHGLLIRRNRDGTLDHLTEHRRTRDQHGDEHTDNKVAHAAASLRARLPERPNLDDPDPDNLDPPPF